MDQNSQDKKEVLDARVAPGASPSATCEPASRGLTSGQKIGAAVAAVVFVILIAVSAFFLFGQPAPDGSKSGGALQTTAPVASSSSSASSAATDASSAASSSSAAAEAPAADQPAAEAPQAPAAGAEGAGAPSVSAPSASEPAPKPEPEAPKPETVTVTISVTSDAVGGGVGGSATLTFEKGATVYDALCGWASQAGVSVNASNSGFGVYVTSIGGIAAGAHGGESGWKYAVDGTEPNVTCGAFTLHDGANIQWRYALNANG